MLPKIDNKKLSQSYYPKIQAESGKDQNIQKLKRIQQFLEEDSYVARAIPFQRHKQSSLHSYRQLNHQNMKKLVSNNSSQLRSYGKPYRSTHKQMQNNQQHHRPGTKRESVRLSELIDITVQMQNKSIKRQFNFRNYKIL